PRHREVGQAIEQRAQYDVPRGLSTLDDPGHVLTPTLEDAAVVREVDAVEGRRVGPRRRETESAPLPDPVPLDDERDVLVPHATAWGEAECLIHVSPSGSGGL